MARRRFHVFLVFLLSSTLTGSAESSGEKEIPWIDLRDMESAAISRLREANAAIPVVAITAGIKENYISDTVFADSGKLERLWYDELLLEMVFPEQVAHTMIPVYIPNASRQGFEVSFPEKGAILSFGVSEHLTMLPDAAMIRLTPHLLRDLKVLDELPAAPDQYNKMVLPFILSPNTTLNLEKAIGWPYPVYEEITAKVAAYMPSRGIPYTDPSSLFEDEEVIKTVVLDVAELQISSPVKYEGQRLTVLFTTKDRDGENPWMNFDLQLLRSTGNKVRFFISDVILEDHLKKETEYISAVELEVVELIEHAP